MVAFNRAKSRLNRVTDALGFEYLDYPKITEKADVRVKRKRTISLMKREAIRSLKAKKEKLLKSKVAQVPKVAGDNGEGSSHSESKPLL